MNKICSFSGFFSQIDMFSIKPSSRITFQNKDVYSSKPGQFFTLLTFFTSLGAFIYFGLNMFLKLHPNTTIAEHYQSTPEFLNITNEMLFMSFGMQNISTNAFIIDETIYVPKFSVIKRNKTHILFETTVSLRPCTINDLPLNSDLYEYFDINPIIGMYCIENYFNLEIEGSEDSNLHAYIDFKIDKCDNQTSSLKCKSDEEISNFFDSTRFYTTLTLASIDALDYQNPFNLHGGFYAIPTQSDQKGNIFFNFQHLDVYTDDGFIFENRRRLKGMTKSSDTIYFTHKKNSDPFIHLTIQMEEVLKKYERSYEKLQSILAKTGGAIQILLIFFGILARPVVHFNFYRDLGNEYFDYEYSIKNENINNHLHKREPMKYTILQHFISFFKKDESEYVRKRNLFENSKQILSNNLSLSQILNKIVELEKMKFLLLDPFQIALFEFIPKPFLSAFSKSNYMGKEKEQAIEKLKRGSPTLKKKKNVIKNWNDTFFEQSLCLKNMNFDEIYNKLSQKKEKNELDNKILESTEFANFFLKNQDLKVFETPKKIDLLKKIEKVEEVKCDINDEKEEKENINHILSISLEDNEIPRSKFQPLAIDSEIILKDVKTLKNIK